MGNVFSYFLNVLNLISSFFNSNRCPYSIFFLTIFFTSKCIFMYTPPTITSGEKLGRLKLTFFSVNDFTYQLVKRMATWSKILVESYSTDLFHSDKISQDVSSCRTFCLSFVRINNTADHCNAGSTMCFTPFASCFICQVFGRTCLFNFLIQSLLGY